MIDTAVNVALLLFRNGALVPPSRSGEFTGLRQPPTDLVQPSAQARVIDMAVNIALLLFRNGALVPRSTCGELAGQIQRPTERLSLLERDDDFRLLPRLGAD